MKILWAAFTLSHLGSRCELGLLLPPKARQKIAFKYSRKQLAALLCDNEANHRPYIFSYIQAWLDRKQTPHKDMRVQRFSGPPVHRAAGSGLALPGPSPVLTCSSTASLPEETLASFMHLPGSELCCLWLPKQCFCCMPFVKPISHDQEVQYQLHNHLITLSGLIITSAGHTRVMTVWWVCSASLLFLQDRFC